MANYTDVCFATTFSTYNQINAYNIGFPGKFLITQWWPSFPGLQTTLYVFGTIQLLLSLLGVLMAFGRTVDPKEGLPVFVQRKVIVFFNSTWQLALSGLILFLPTQWLSNITMGMILYHSWSEFFAMVLRIMILRHALDKQSYALFWKWAVLAVVFTIIPFMLTFNPYIQGIITVVFVLPSDFLNLFVAPIVSFLFLKNHNGHKHLTNAEKASELLIGILNVLHVIWFYGQGIVACSVSVEAGAQFFIALQIISTVVLAGANISYALTIHHYSEWEAPFHAIESLFACCYKNYGKHDEAEAVPVSFGASEEDLTV